MKIGKFDTIDGEAAGYNCFVSVRTEEHATITKYNTRYFNPIREQGTFFVKPNGGGGAPSWREEEVKLRQAAVRKTAPLTAAAWQLSQSHRVPKSKMGQHKL